MVEGLDVIVNWIKEAGQSRLYKKGETVYREKQKATGLFFIEKGYVGLTKMTSNGAESLLRLFKQGQILGHRSMFSNEDYHSSANCLDECVIYFCKKEKIEEKLRLDPRCYLPFVKILSLELKYAENRSFLVSEGEIVERVASALFFLKNIYADHKWTRKEIAGFCASRTPTVIKVLGRLQDEGAITQHQREIEIIDESKLEKYLFEIL